MENVKHIKLIQMFPNRCLTVITEHLCSYITLSRYIIRTFYGHSTVIKVCQWVIKMPSIFYLECLLLVTFFFRCRNNPALRVTLLSERTAMSFCDVTELPGIHYFQMRADVSRVATRADNGKWYLSCK
jgi:hypothetical protein